MIYRFFDRAAQVVSEAIGSTTAFLIAAAAIVVWGVSGPFFGFNDTWQLVVNTSTTIFTFLMLFLVQRTQNRDSVAVQLKLDELIRVTEASNLLLDLEETDEATVRKFRERFRELAKAAQNGK
jgi:low affinity Fe/Cu permease